LHTKKRRFYIGEMNVNQTGARNAEVLWPFRDAQIEREIVCLLGSGEKQNKK
jgi:hypothetical protein